MPSVERYHEVNMKLFVVDEVLQQRLKPLLLGTSLPTTFHSVTL